jgi:hypothetical protein
MSDIKIINIKSLKLSEGDQSFFKGSSDDEEEYRSQGGSENSSSDYKEENSEGGFEDSYEEENRSDGNELNSFLGEGGSEKLDDYIGDSEEEYDKMLFEDEEDPNPDPADQIAGSKKTTIEEDSLIDELSGDPMLLVLTKFLISKKGNNIADILEEIKDHLFYIRGKLTTSH